MKNLELTVLAPNISVEAIDEALTMVVTQNWAALTVPPFWVKKLRRDMGASHQVLLATVVGYPFGFGRTETKQTETEWALKDGANEIQVVLNTSAWFSNSNSWPKIELAKLGKLIHAQEALFTVMIETPFFDVENFAVVAKIAADAGADFIQIGTGFFNQSVDYQKIEQMKSFLPTSVGLKITTTKMHQEVLQKWEKMGVERVCTPFLP